MATALLDPPAAAPPSGANRPAGDARTGAPLRLPDPDGSPPGTRVVWDGVDWDAYVALADDPAHARFKFTYDEPTGRLEVEMPNGYVHEVVADALGLLIAAFARERGLRTKSTGSLSLRRRRRGGADGDRSFYITNFDRRPPWGTNLLNLAAGQTPPDLVIEVDVTSPSPGVSKLPIYARLGVPEVWVWRDDEIVCRRLAEGENYEVVTDSVELLGFPLAFAAELIRDRPDAGDGELQDALAARLRGDG